MAESYLDQGFGGCRIDPESRGWRLGGSGALEGCILQEEHLRMALHGGMWMEKPPLPPSIGNIYSTYYLLRTCALYVLYGSIVIESPTPRLPAPCFQWLKSLVTSNDEALFAISATSILSIQIWPPCHMRGIGSSRSPRASDQLIRSIIACYYGPSVPSPRAKVGSPGTWCQQVGERIEEAA